VGENGPVLRAARMIALAGASLALAAAALVTLSVTARWLTSRGVPGDFELVQMASAIAIFSFLPLTQLRSANILVDTFTRVLPPWVARALDGVWDLVYAAAAGLIAWRLALGAADALRSQTGTMVLLLPIGWAIAVCAALMAVLAVAGVLTAVGRWSVSREERS